MPPFTKITSVADTPSKVQKVIENLKDWAEGDGAMDLNEVGAAASRFPDDFFVGEQRYVPLSDVIHTITTEMDLVSMDMGEVPELVARALLLDFHKLTPLIVEKAFPAGVQLELYNLRAQAWAGTLMKTQGNVVTAGDAFEPNLQIQTRYLKIVQGLNMAKARLNAIMTRVSRKSGKAKRSECVLGNDIRDEDVVKLLGDHRMEVVPGFDNTKSAFDSYGSANSKDSRDTDHAATLLRVERLLS